MKVIEFKIHEVERFERLVEMANAESGVVVIGYALQMYEWLLQQALAGHTFKVVGPDGVEKPIELFKKSNVVVFPKRGSGEE